METQALELAAAVFDLGGVLTTPILPSFAAFEREHGLPEGALVGLFVRGYSAPGGPDAEDFHLLETGRISEAEYYRRLERRLREEHGDGVRFPTDPASVRRGLFRAVRRNEPMIDAARRIGEHYPVALLTNNVKEWGGWRRYYPQDIFDVVVDSCEVGLRKPDPEIYRITCERLGVAPERASFVDDVGANVEAARDLGMVAIHFTSNDEVLARLRELFPKAFARGPIRGEGR